jgi:hypothetical protein
MGPCLTSIHRFSTFTQNAVIRAVPVALFIGSTGSDTIVRAREPGVAQVGTNKVIRATRSLPNCFQIESVEMLLQRGGVHDVQADD